jgi:predicted nucleic acid-binding protein
LKVLLAADRGDIQLVASTLVVVEVAGWNGDIDPIKRDEVIDNYLNEKVDWYEVDLLVARDARRYCDAHKMRGPDATHLATAVRAKADWLMTRDEKFPIGQMVDGVRIERPSLVWDPTFDDAEVDSQADIEEAAPHQRALMPRLRKKLPDRRSP